MNSNGVVEFSHTQEQPFLNNQVPLESYKTGTTNITLATAQNITPNLLANMPVRETKGKYIYMAIG